MPDLDEFLDHPKGNNLYSKLNLTGIIFIIGTIVLIIVIILYFIYQRSETNINVIETKQDSYMDSKDIYIDISGAVKTAGVYHLSKGARVEEVLITAGGLQETADKEWVQKQLNLAATLSDGQKIYIPFEGEAPQTSISLPSSVLGTSSKININNATQNSLEALPRIGPVTAEKIILYRQENGNFTSIEDLKKVPGIGEGLYDQIKELITVLDI